MLTHTMGAFKCLLLTSQTMYLFLSLLFPPSHNVIDFFFFGHFRAEPLAYGGIFDPGLVVKLEL